MAHQWRGVIDEYRDRLPVSDKTPVVTLREGGTPLVYACVLSEMLGNNVWLKVEGANPTGSFKDRGMTMAISKAAEDGAKAVICASTGNTSAAAAAYATKAGMIPVVLVPQGKIAMGKLAQAIAHGGRLLQVEGNFDDCLNLARDLSKDYPVSLVNSVNPFRIEGQKTASFEVVDLLGDAPDMHVMAIRSITQTRSLQNFPSCGDSRLRALHRLCRIKLLKIQRQLQQRFASATRLRGRKQLKHVMHLVV
jgi:threonine synthase